jgi:hypothetical protein
MKERTIMVQGMQWKTKEIKSSHQARLLAEKWEASVTFQILATKTMRHQS